MMKVHIQEVLKNGSSMLAKMDEDYSNMVAFHLEELSFNLGLLAEGKISQDEFCEGYCLTKKGEK